MSQKTPHGRGTMRVNLIDKLDFRKIGSLYCCNRIEF